VDAYSKWIIYHFITVHILFFPWYQKFENGRDVALKVTSESKKKTLYGWLIGTGSKLWITLARKTGRRVNFA
jgi:hypothetical protein